MWTPRVGFASRACGLAAAAVCLDVTAALASPICWAENVADEEAIVCFDLVGGKSTSLVDWPLVASPDGRWLAYMRAGASGGRWEVVVIPFAPAWPEHQRDLRWVVSQGISHMPRWSREDDELFYVDQNGRLMSVDVEIEGDSIAFSTPRLMFQTPWDIGRNYDVFPEGVGRDNDFAFVDATRRNEVGISVVLNWQSLLSKE